MESLQTKSGSVLHGSGSVPISWNQFLHDNETKAPSIILWLLTLPSERDGSDQERLNLKMSKGKFKL